MARRRKKSNFWKSTQEAFSTFLQLSLKVIPLVVIMVMGGALFFGVRNALYADTNLAIQNILVEPSKGLSAKTIRRLESQYLGRNILKVDLEKIANSLQKTARIRQASVQREFPTDLKIVIEERAPIGLIQFRSGGKYGLISDDGMILDVLTSKSEAFLVFELYGSGIKNPKTGLQVRSPGFEEAVSFKNAYEKTPMSENETLERIVLDKLGNVTIKLDRGPKVRLGRKPSQRVHAMEKILPLLDGKKRNGIDYIDLQYDDVIVKQKK